MSATVAPGKNIADVESALYEEIEKVKAGPIAGWEIEKSHNFARRNQANAATSSLSRAVMLGEYAMFYNDPNLINTRTGKILKVTAADVQRVAQKYLTKENRSVVITTPKAAGTAPKGGQQ
jgi:predicted Zn-dependent peptidase